jgi:hypothetical protein
MFELLVPPGQLDRPKGHRKVYDLEVRPRLMAQTIQELQDAGIEPDVWKIQGLERQGLRTDRRYYLTRRPEPSWLRRGRDELLGSTG